MQKSPGEDARFFYRRRFYGGVVPNETMFFCGANAYALRRENWAAAAIRRGKWSASESRYFGRHFVVFGRLPDIDTG